MKTNETQASWQIGASTGGAFIRERRAVKVFALLALIVSAGLHFGAWPIVRDMIVISPEPYSEPEFRTMPVQLKLIEIDQIDLTSPQDSTSDEAEQLKEIATADVAEFVDDIDPFEAQKKAVMNEIKLTPEVTQIENLTVENPSTKVSPSLALEDSLKSLIETESMSSQLAKTDTELLQQPQISPEQLTLNSPIDEESIISSEILRRQLEESLKKSGSNGAIADGFSSLDDIIAGSGPVGDKTMPILMPTDLLFAYNSADLKDSARLSLMKLGIIIQRNPKATFIIEGHTDTIGTEEYNLDLSRKRAETVYYWLVNSLRIDQRQLQVEAYGKSRPLVNPNGNEEEQAPNRRVVITIRG